MIVSDLSSVPLDRVPMARLSVVRFYGHGDLMHRNGDLFPWLFAQSVPQRRILR